MRTTTGPVVRSRIGVAHAVSAKTSVTQRVVVRRCISGVHLTVKLRAARRRPPGAVGAHCSSNTRGDTTDVHGPLQRLLGGNAILLLLGRERKEPFVAIRVVDLDHVIPPPRLPGWNRAISNLGT